MGFFVVRERNMISVYYEYIHDVGKDSAKPMKYRFTGIHIDDIDRIDTIERCRPLSTVSTVEHCVERVMTVDPSIALMTWVALKEYSSAKLHTLRTRETGTLGVGSALP
jgi:hypothetical protein